VRPYVKRSKNDASDAEAICEAVTRVEKVFIHLANNADQARLLALPGFTHAGCGWRHLIPPQPPRLAGCEVPAWLAR
jgi:hypothetical protein